MPDIAKVLRTEIARLARKEVRAELGALKAASAAHRAEIIALRRRVLQLESALRRLSRTPAATSAGDADAEAGGAAMRFSAKGLASNRRRLGLSAEDFGRLLGVSAQSVYKWEEGAVRPRARHLPLIAALRTIGKKEAAARLAAGEAR